MQQTAEAIQLNKEAGNAERICTTTLKMAMNCLKKARKQRCKARKIWREVGKASSKIDYYAVTSVEDDRHESSDSDHHSSADETIIEHQEQRSRNTSLPQNLPPNKKRKITDYFSR